jgi:hypothetical protein
MVLGYWGRREDCNVYRYPDTKQNSNQSQNDCELLRSRLVCNMQAKGLRLDTPSRGHLIDLPNHRTDNNQLYPSPSTLPEQVLLPCERKRVL